MSASHAGRWDYCQYCGSIGWVDWGYTIHSEAGSCPNNSWPWYGANDEIIAHAAEECARLNKENGQPVTMEDIADIPDEDCVGAEDKTP